MLTVGAPRGLWLLPWPYRACVAVGPAAELGSILVCDLLGGTKSLTHALAFQAERPWCPVCLVVRDLPADALLLGALAQLRGSLAYVAPSSESGPPAPAEIVAAVRARPAATPEMLASFVTMRIGDTTSRTVLQRCFDGEIRRASAGDTPYRTLCRRVGQLGRLTPSDWLATGRLAALAGGRNQSVEEMARACRTEPRTLRLRIARLIGVSLAALRERAGWEWAVEAALRRWYQGEKERLPIAMGA